MPLSDHTMKAALDKARELVMTVTRVRMIAYDYDNQVLGHEGFDAKPGETINWLPIWKKLSYVDAICYDERGTEIYRNRFYMIWPQDLTFRVLVDMEVNFDDYGPGPE